MIYDINNICFLKVNSFICKTFKMLQQETFMKKLKNMYEEDPKKCEDFFTTYFFLVSLLLIYKDKNGEEYYTQMSRYRKGFYFDMFKINFEKYFGYPEFKVMIEFLDILQTQFRKSCDDKDVLKKEEVNDNSIDLDRREQCSICLEYTSEEDVHLNPCNHCFHMKCVKDMVSNNTTKCPLCKRVILGVKEDPTFIVNSINNQQSLFNGGDILSNQRNLFLFREDSRPSRNERPSDSTSIFGGRLFPSNQSQDNHIGLFNENNNSLFGNNNTRSLFSTNLFG